MRYMNPHLAAHTIYLDDKSAPRYRSNRRPLPRYPSGGDILFFSGKYVLSWQLHKDFLFFVKSHPELLNPLFVPEYVPNTSEDHDEGQPEELPTEFDRPADFYSMCYVPFPAELRVKELAIQEIEAQALEKSSLTRCRDRCLKKMYAAFTEDRGFPQSIAVRELTVRFKLPSHVVRRMLRMTDLNAPDMRRFRKEINDSRLERVYKVMLGARGIATAKKVNGGFGIKDVLPYHPGSSAQYIPPRCPVLGLELDYAEDRNKQLNSVRVGRKTTARPYEPGNVTVMSFLATRLIEGSIGRNKAFMAADADIAAHWRAWSAAHETNWGKVQLGRPVGSKTKNRKATTNTTAMTPVSVEEQLNEDWI